MKLPKGRVVLTLAEWVPIFHEGSFDSCSAKRTYIRRIGALGGSEPMFSFAGQQ
jgi:hypothetical protein